MDLKGSLVDTSLRLHPSQKLKSFLENEKFGKSLPENIGKLVMGKAYSLKDDQADSKPLNIYLNKKDLEKIIRIKKKFDHVDVQNGETRNEGVDATEKTDRQCDEKISDKDNEQINKVDKDNEQKNKVDKDNEQKNKVEKEECIKEKEECKKEKEECKEKLLFLTTSDIDWLYTYIKERKNKGDDVPYLHELLEGSNIELPENATIKRNPELEARCVKLRAQQEAREYRKMTKGVDNVRMRFPEDSISYQLKQMNRQLIAIGQFIISIFAGFLFGFRGIEWMVGNLDFGFRLLLGVMCALIIALAEIYFLAKKLNEELSVPETTQLGGPPTFADDRFDGNKISKPVDKPHQD